MSFTLLLSPLFYPHSLLSLLSFTFFFVCPSGSVHCPALFSASLLSPSKPNSLLSLPQRLIDHPGGEQTVVCAMNGPGVLAVSLSLSPRGLSLSLSFSLISPFLLRYSILFLFPPSSSSPNFLPSVPHPLPIHSSGLFSRETAAQTGREMGHRIGRLTGLESSFGAFSSSDERGTTE